MKTEKILLIQPPLGRGMTKDLFQPIFPYGLAYVAAFLSDAGHQVTVLDIYANRWTRKEVLEKIEDLDADIIGIGAMSTQYSYVKWLTEELKKQGNFKIVLGGLLATCSYQTVLANTRVDFCVLGEGERTMVDLVEHIDQPQKVKGIAYKDNGAVLTTQPRDYIENLDTLPSPAYDLFPMDVYTKTKFYIHDPSTKIFKRKLNFKTMGVLTGRGCPYNCRFCSKSFKGLRLKSVDTIVNEIKFLKQKYGIEGVHFIDELFVVNKKRAYELVNKLAPLGLKWDAQARVNTVDYELLCEMKKAGCVAVGFGIESGSNKILQSMNKRITAEQSIDAMEAAMKAGLHTKVQLIIGYPGETEETVAETVRLFEKIKHPARRLSLLLPLPGSPLYDDAVARGLIKNEEEYLLKIYDGYGASRYPVFINFTDLTTEQIYRLKKNAEKMMETNYRRYLMSHPAIYLNHLYAASMNSIYNLIRRAVKFCSDPVYYTSRLWLRLKKTA